jgi:hypothetical protein
MTKNLNAFCPCPGTLWLAEFKSDQLIYLLDEISRTHRIQAVACISLAAFRQIYSENQEEKADIKI